MHRIIGKKIIKYSELDSTNDEAKRLIRAGLSEGVVIVAGLQTKGRGKPSRSWFSPVGDGVYLSAIVKPYISPKDLSSITSVGAIAVINTIKNLSGLLAKVKLPNDVMLNGKKISGVLTERVLGGHVIIGIGVNINNELGSFPDEIKNAATSLKIELGEVFDPDLFLEQLILELDKEYIAYLAKI